MWTIIEENEMGVRLEARFDHSIQKYRMRITQPVDGIINENVRVRNHRGKDWKGEIVQYASIPTTMMRQWSREMGVKDCYADDDLIKYTKKHYINNRDYRTVRTNDGTA